MMPNIRRNVVKILSQSRQGRASMVMLIRLKSLRKNHPTILSLKKFKLLIQVTFLRRTSWRSNKNMTNMESYMGSLIRSEHLRRNHPNISLTKLWIRIKFPRSNLLVGSNKSTTIVSIHSSQYSIRRHHHHVALISSLSPTLNQQLVMMSLWSSITAMGNNNEGTVLKVVLTLSILLQILPPPPLWRRKSRR